jgi:hypothetical protein
MLDLARNRIITFASFLRTREGLDEITEKLKGNSL